MLIKTKQLGICDTIAEPQVQNFPTFLIVTPAIAHLNLFHLRPGKKMKKIGCAAAKKKDDPYQIQKDVLLGKETEHQGQTLLAFA